MASFFLDCEEDVLVLLTATTNGLLSSPRSIDDRMICRICRSYSKYLPIRIVIFAEI